MTPPAARFRRRLAILLAALAAAGCGARQRPSPAPAPRTAAPAPTARPDAPRGGTAVADAPILFREASDTGIGFVHTDGSSGRRYLVEPLSAGVATFDYDGDGRVDVYFPNGAPLPGTPAGAAPPRHALYRNLGGWHFRDASLAAGIDCRAFGLGVVAGDVDEDGLDDLFLTTFGPKLLWRNNGDGTFTAAGPEAGVADGEKVGAGAALLDADGDGDLEIYAANYVRYALADHVVRTVKGQPAYAGPRDHPPCPDTFLRNDGDGRFSDASAEAGISAHAGPGMGVVCLDYDDDGDDDVYVGNDALHGNFLFASDGRGAFREVGLEAGVAVNRFGAEIGSMGTEAGDADGDGRIDLFVTDFQPDLPVLFRNLGGGQFEDATAATGAGAPAWRFVTWGTVLADFDNDGARDLFIGCGHLNDNVADFDDTTAYRNHNLLLRSEGGRFVDVSAAAGLHDVAPHAARGVACDDLDDDGDLDLVILNSREAPTLLVNLDRERGGSNHWCRLRLRGRTGNRGAVGARVRVVAGDLAQVDHVRAGRGYQGHFGTRLHFGLGPRGAVDRVEVRWPGGRVETFAVPVDRDSELVEGTGAPVPAGGAER
ncbi:MAG: CRTAC1 family protein [Planctomycetaceae bacterium]